MDDSQQQITNALLQIPFKERTDERIQAELDSSVAELQRIGQMDELEPAMEAAIRAMVPMPATNDPQQRIINALLAIPFVQRTEECIRLELSGQVWSMFRSGELEDDELDPMMEVAIRKAVPMPTDADLYTHYKDAVLMNLEASVGTGRKPTFLEVCQAADDEMKGFPFSYGSKKGVKYEIVRTKIINDIESAADICEACGAAVESMQWGSTYCSRYCWSRADND